MPQGATRDKFRVTAQPGLDAGGVDDATDEWAVGLAAAGKFHGLEGPDGKAGEFGGDVVGVAEFRGH